jgi:hypothetical protein
LGEPDEETINRIRKALPWEASGRWTVGLKEEGVKIRKEDSDVKFSSRRSKLEFGVSKQGNIYFEFVVFRLKREMCEVGVRNKDIIVGVGSSRKVRPADWNSAHAILISIFPKVGPMLRRRRELRNQVQLLHITQTEGQIRITVSRALSAKEPSNRIYFGQDGIDTLEEALTFNIDGNWRRGQRGFSSEDERPPLSTDRPVSFSQVGFYITPSSARSTLY